MKNFFNVAYPRFNDIFQNQNCISHISLALDLFLLELKVSDSTEDIKNQILNDACSFKSINQYEKNVNKIILETTEKINIEKALDSRAKRYFHHTKKYLKGKSLLDIGSGDGKIAKHFSTQGLDVTLTDVYKHPSIDSLNMEFNFHQPNEILPFKEGKFDNVLLITVLHHCEDPSFTLKEAIRVLKPGGVILIIESVYGVASNIVSLNDNSITKSFLKLDFDEQFAVNMFFDHLYNRCLFYSDEADQKVNTPFNYRSPELWNKTLIDSGFTEVSKVYLGYEQPIAPIYHTLHFGIKDD
ncbi:MAG: class I SAM-dependent methyltransferase [Bacteroidetes bacterium]|nr:class I SAM-dependent methyltransferase [Bacteroidota bacterium]MBU1115031.1 class I SAM-dependent methyltransferase [Bacteroidota bacterium]MBU1799523.1 class I SAM-dependent methyltransferase [Bacteroidota bacterium]